MYTHTYTHTNTHTHLAPSDFLSDTKLPIILEGVQASLCGIQEDLRTLRLDVDEVKTGNQLALIQRQFFFLVDFTAPTFFVVVQPSSPQSNLQARHPEPASRMPNRNTEG
jgi:hypothetical protein